MELFNEYYNSEVQFLLSLFSFNRPFSENEAISAAKISYAYAPYSNYINLIYKWINLGLIEKCGEKRYQVSCDPHLNFFAAPMNSLESEYLLDIANTKEAELFSNEPFKKCLGMQDGYLFDYIRHQNSLGKQGECKKVNPLVFRTILSAIYEQRSIEYDYCTNNNPKIKKSKAIPYRFEHSVFDGRWWLISYSEDQDRIIKSRLENIKSVTLGDKHNATEDVIRSAILRHVAPEPVVLYITDEKNALERCFLCFEDMLEMTAFKMNENKYKLMFMYFDWDLHVIARKLLYLGENVVLQSPTIIKKEIIGDLNTALTTKFH